ncbi:MAG: MFS transporter [Rhodospirillales bacterium]|nr:MFS transporter [Rhodospirillales bacterium]
MRPDQATRNVILLTAALALSMTGIATLATVSALAGQMLATDKRLATLPLAIQFTMIMVSTVPASLLMRRIGRRAGFLLGQTMGIAAGCLSALGIIVESFWLFAAAGGLVGVHMAVAQYYRFAAAETAKEAFKARAISWVMAGGVIAAIAGPEIAKFTHTLIPGRLYAGAFIAIAGLSAAAMVIVAFLDMPRPAVDREPGSGRPLAVIARQPAFVVAVLSAMLGWGVMNLVMTATPLAMHDHDHSFPDTAFAIQWHILGMYAPSFFTGDLIRRFGITRILIAGAVLNLVAVAINVTGTSVAHFCVAMFVIGIGWNFLFVGGTTLLTETYRPEERAKTQGFNDFLVFATTTVSSFSSGALQHALGWEAVNLGAVVPMIAVLAAAAWLAAHRSRPAQAG